jgi:hypothetical protein
MAHILSHGKDIIEFFMQVELNVQMYHWMTKSFSRHKATDALFGNLVQQVDKFMEVYIGKFGRPKIIHETIHVQCMSDTSFKKYLETVASKLEAFDTRLGTDLMNLRDEILSSIHQTLYLFTLQ